MTKDAVIEFDKQGTNWDKEIMPKDIFERTYDIAHFLLNHSHPIIDQIKPVIFGKYRVRMKFWVHIYANASSIWVSGRWICMRRSKNSPVIFNRDVVLLEGTPTGIGGSNAYPKPSFKEGYCILEFISTGLPMTDWSNGWKSELLLLEKID